MSNFEAPRRRHRALWNAGSLLRWATLCIIFVLFAMIHTCSAVQININDANGKPSMNIANDEGPNLPNPHHKLHHVEFDINAPPEELQHLSEQERIDTMIRAFNRLPAPELDRLGVDLSKPVAEGTPQAKELFEIWKKRQEELKEAMAEMVKPVEHMAQIASKLREHNRKNNEETIELLTELEANLADVDNARDFHTIGGWPVIASYLSNEQ